MLRRLFVSILMLASAPVRAEVPDWKVIIHVDSSPLQPGQCTSAWVVAKDAKGQSIVDAAGIQAILHRNFALSITGDTSGAFELKGDTTRGWMDLCARKDSAGRKATLVARYPSETVLPAARLPGVTFETTVKIGSGPANAGIASPVAPMHPPGSAAATRSIAASNATKPDASAGKPGMARVGGTGPTSIGPGRKSGAVSSSAQAVTAEDKAKINAYIESLKNDPHSAIAYRGYVMDESVNGVAIPPAVQEREDRIAADESAALLNRDDVAFVRAFQARNNRPPNQKELDQFNYPSLTDALGAQRTRTLLGIEPGKQTELDKIVETQSRNLIDANVNRNLQAFKDLAGARGRTPQEIDAFLHPSTADLLGNERTLMLLTGEGSPKGSKLDTALNKALASGLPGLPADPGAPAGTLPMGGVGALGGKPQQGKSPGSATGAGVPNTDFGAGNAGQPDLPGKSPGNTGGPADTATTVGSGKTAGPGTGDAPEPSAPPADGGDKGPAPSPPPSSPSSGFTPDSTPTDVANSVSDLAGNIAAKAGGSGSSGSGAGADGAEGGRRLLVTGGEVQMEQGIGREAVNADGSVDATDREGTVWHYDKADNPTTVTRTTKDGETTCVLGCGEKGETSSDTAGEEKKTDDAGKDETYTIATDQDRGPFSQVRGNTTLTANKNPGTVTNSGNGDLAAGGARAVPFNGAPSTADPVESGNTLSAGTSPQLLANRNPQTVTNPGRGDLETGGGVDTGRGPGGQGGISTAQSASTAGTVAGGGSGITAAGGGGKIVSAATKAAFTVGDIVAPTAGGVALLSGPSGTASTLGTITAADRLVVLVPDRGGFAGVRTAKASGWIRKELLQPAR